MEKELVFAGFGGQGVLTLGLIVAESALELGKQVTWMPAYGPTMRGGKAYSVVKFSDESIGGPDMEEIDVLVAMNKPSLDYINLVKEGGTVVINTSAIDENVTLREDISVVKINCQELAQKVNNPKAANIVVLGALIAKTGLFEKELALKTMCDFFEEKGKGNFNVQNEAAFMEGYNNAI